MADVLVFSTYTQAEVAVGGDIVFNYPDGVTQELISAGGEILVIPALQSAVEQAPDTFTVVYDTTKATVTYKGGAPIPAFSKVMLQMVHGAPEVSVTWANVTGKPQTYPTDWASIDGKPNPIPTTWDAVASKPNFIAAGGTADAARSAIGAGTSNLILVDPGGLNGGSAQAARSDHSHAAATGSTAGLMTAADKAKLDGIAAGANNYVLPNATTSVRGGVLQSAAHADSVATDAAGLLADFNALLAKLRTAGILAS